MMLGGGEGEKEGWEELSTPYAMYNVLNGKSTYNVGLLE
jgi:hypothetical protein